MNIQMFCGLNAKYHCLISNIENWLQKFGMSSFHFCSVYFNYVVDFLFLCDCFYYKSIFELLNKKNIFCDMYTYTCIVLYIMVGYYFCNSTTGRRQIGLLSWYYVSCFNQLMLYLKTAQRETVRLAVTIIYLHALRIIDKCQPSLFSSFESNQSSAEKGAVWHSKSISSLPKVMLLVLIRIVSMTRF